MDDSGYFDGSKFRAIDSDATGDDYPLSSVLEASICNQHNYLHRFGGGSVTRHMGAAGNGTQYASNYQTHVSLDESSIFAQPFLLTRGLKSITVKWIGSVEFEDRELGVWTRLELVGVGSTTPQRWFTNDYPANNIYEITLDLPSPVEDEREVLLVLWGRGEVDADTNVGDYNFAISDNNSGLIRFPDKTDVVIGTEHFRVMAAYNWILTLSGEELVSRISFFEPLLRSRVPAGSGDYYQSARVTSKTSYANLLAMEWKIGGLTSRSITITSESI